MRSFILLLILCAPLKALEITDWELPSKKRLVEVTFSDNGPNASLRVHSTVTLYLSERERGGERETWVWIDGKRYIWSEPDSETDQKAARCFALLISITQPEDVPADPEQVVTVRWKDGWIERRYSNHKVPSQVREILLTMGFRDEEFKHHLAFE